MNIICLVPSITETLIACDVKLVGRSRFCIHPSPQVETIVKVGGTKDIDWEKCRPLRPDLIVLDKEENTLQMAESCPWEYIALHISNIADVSGELLKLAKKINSKRLEQTANRWQLLSTKTRTSISLNAIPGIIQWWKKPIHQTQVEYLIWKDPWMAIGEDTFIQSVLDYVGLEGARIKHADKYPQIDLNKHAAEDTCLLFSSEPFPFERYKKELVEMGYSCGLIDGEKYSWYGVRSLQFLENLAE